MNVDALLLFLADDDNDDREIFKEALEELNVNTKVITFENGVDLMANLLDDKTELPNYLFLDLNMPMMTGEECLEDIKNETLLNQIPIIIYSTYFDEAEALILRKKGAHRYIQKPKSFALLKTCLERCLISLSHEITENKPASEFIIE